MIEFDALGCLEVGLCVIGSGLFRFWFIMRWLCGSLIYHSGLSEFLHHVFFFGIFCWRCRSFLCWLKCKSFWYLIRKFCFWLLVYDFFFSFSGFLPFLFGHLKFDTLCWIEQVEIFWLHHVDFCQTGECIEACWRWVMRC